MKAVIAIDLGASSGRVMVGYLQDQNIKLEEFHRFKNEQVIRNNNSCWDLETIFSEIKIGIQKVIDANIEVNSLGIDTWGVDFVLLDKQGKHLGDFVSYRDERTQGMLDKLLSDSGLSKEDVYASTGIQFLPFNSIFQLKAIADDKPEWFSEIDSLLFIPDYLNYRLSGVKHCEYTNASTSQLLNCHTKQWDESLITACGAKSEWFLPAQLPNKIIGEYELGEISIPVCSVASHDTASAVAATPLTNANTAYLSSGTWSLVGIESETPVTGELAFANNLTNEGGVDGRFRILKNIMGLWLIQRFKAENPAMTFNDITALASTTEPFKFIINPNDDCFLNPPSMTKAIQAWFAEREMPVPQTQSEIVRCIYDSLALAYDAALTSISAATQRNIEELRIVGGGTQDHLLNQLCADVCQITVKTEPKEASALGNVANQFIALQDIDCLATARQIIENSSDVKTFLPNVIEGLSKVKEHYQKII